MKHQVYDLSDFSYFLDPFCQPPKIYTHSLFEINEIWES